MKKNFLRTAVAVAAGVAASVATATDVDQRAATVVPITVATEVTINPTTGTTFTGVGQVKFATGFSIAASTRYIRLDLTGATWGAGQPGTTIEVANTTTGAANFAETLASGGTANDSFAIYEIVADGSNTATSTANVDFTPNSGLTLTSESGVTISYGLYETAGDAVASTNPLASDSGALIAFAAGNTTAASTATPSAIDVTVSTATGAVFANGTSQTVVGSYNIADTAGVENITGNAAGTANIESTSTLTLVGDNTWMQNLDASNVPDGNYDLTDAAIFTSADCNASNSPTSSATSITDTNMVFTTTGDGADVFFVCLTGNGVSAIPEQTYTATYASVGGAGYDDESTAMTLSAIAKNGDSQTLPLVLTPGGSFKNFIRVSNTSTISGDVTFSIVADDGTSVSAIPLSSISGQSNNALSGGSSTTLIDINDLYAAAQGQDATFDAGTGKLRVTVNGNFQSINVQNISTSNDNNSFDTF